MESNNNEETEAPLLDSYFASVDEIFDAYLAYVKEKGFNITKKYVSKGTRSFIKY